MHTYPTSFLYADMNRKAVIFLFMLLLLLLAFSSLPPTIAVPSSRALKSFPDEKTPNRHLRDGFQKERLGVDTADYSGTGANNRHDPRSPPGS